MPVPPEWSDPEAGPPPSAGHPAGCTGADGSGPGVGAGTRGSGTGTGWVDGARSVRTVPVGEGARATAVRFWARGVAPPDPPATPEVVAADGLARVGVRIDAGPLRATDVTGATTGATADVTGATTGATADVTGVTTGATADVTGTPT